jgi:sugar lactone lactonase YvrE
MRLIASMNPGPEGVGVCPNGEVFAGAGEVLWRIPLDGSAPERFTTLPGRSLESIACDADGRIFVADIAASVAYFLGQTPEKPPAVVMVQRKDDPGTELIGPVNDATLSGFNGLLELPGLGFYATDMFAGLVVRFVETAPGQFVSSIVKDAVPGANGIAYDPNRGLLYITQTGLWGDPDLVVSMPMHDDGSLGPTTTLWSSNDGDGVDGLAIDDDGVVYRANQAAGTVTRMTDETVIAMPPNPASLAFRGGTMLMTDFKVYGVLQNGGEGGVYAIDLGVCDGPRTR